MYMQTHLHTCTATYNSLNTARTQCNNYTSKYGHSRKHVNIHVHVDTDTV